MLLELPPMQTIDLDGPVVYRSWAGPSDTTFVLVHGLASNLRLWDGVAEDLHARGHTVVAVDQRGHGSSGQPDHGYDFATLGRDLAAACRDHFSRPVNFVLWGAAEIAIAACDLAEVIGSAIALNLIFHIPLLWGVCLTGLDVLIILFLQQKGFRFLEALVVSLIATVSVCFGLEILFSKPSLVGLAHGFFVPSPQILRDPGMLYIAIGILGATVMPHNLYLHSALVQSRQLQKDQPSVRRAIQFNTIDSVVALSIAFFVNAAILVLAATVFFGRESVTVATGQVVNHTYWAAGPQPVTLTASDGTTPARGASGTSVRSATSPRRS